LTRIEDRNSSVKAWAYLDPDFVIAQAKMLDELPDHERGPLFGIAVGIKDVMNTKGAAHEIHNHATSNQLVSS
jgi:Asp-tRNA(Asn)/Glu-tRNA(Gln) amidotransferase A subunit family amidase